MSNDLESPMRILILNNYKLLIFLLCFTPLLAHKELLLAELNATQQRLEAIEKKIQTNEITVIDEHHNAFGETRRVLRIRYLFHYYLAQDELTAKKNIIINQLNALDKIESK
jgi:hypothetical protein